jgi:hypothetical protein
MHFSHAHVGRKSPYLVGFAILFTQIAFASPQQITSNGIEAPRVVSAFPAAPESHYPFRQNMYRALQLPDGRVIALSVARSSDRQQTMQGRYSTDQGEKWSEPQDLFQWPREEGGFGLFDALVDNKGEIHIWILGDANSGILYPKEQEAVATRPGEILDIWYARSRYGRTKWDTPKPIWKGHGSDLLSVIQLRKGRLLLPFAYAKPRTWSNRGGGFLDFTFVGAYSVSSVYSDDDGETWMQSANELVVQTPDLGTYGADEPVVLELKDGRVWMLMRTQRGRFYESFSSDGGATWSASQPSKLISSDSPAGLARLKDGNILLFSNACLRYPYAYGARNVLHVAISEDEGKTWRGFREVTRDPLRNDPPSSHNDYGLAYTFPTVLTDGRILFSNWVESGRQRTFRRFDPKWIYETRQATDLSKGMDDWSIFGSKGVTLQTDAGGAKVLEIRKEDKDWPAAAVWNFPIGSKGTLKLQMKVQPGFGGARLGLTDHFSVPWDLEDQFYNVFDLVIGPDGEIVRGTKLSPGAWHDVVLDWDTSARHCRITIDGKSAGIVEDDRKSTGINYLRLHSIAQQPDQGLQVRAVSADVSASWKAAASARPAGTR